MTLLQITVMTSMVRARPWMIVADRRGQHWHGDVRRENLTRVASRGGDQVGQPLRLKVQLDQQRERSVAEAARGASTGMHPLDYSECVPGIKPTTGIQAAASRGTSTGMHRVGCSRMCAWQQCYTPLPYHKFVHTDLLLQPVCLEAMGIAWCNDVALVQRCRTARVWIHPLLTPYWADATMHVRHTRCLPAMQCRILQRCCALDRKKQTNEGNDVTFSSSISDSAR